ncbi:hypothetical protein [Pseudomonas putida]
MPRRTRNLLLILVTLTFIALATLLDWSLPGKWYQGYRQIQALGDQQNQYDETLKSIKQQFGETAGYTINVSISGSGETLRTLRATRQCGDMDDSRFLAQVTGQLHQAGLPWPDKVEYVYSCNWSALPSLGMVVPVLTRALGARLKADAQCGDVQTGALTQAAGYWQQSLYVHDGAADLRLYVGKSGDAERAQVVAWTQMMEPQVQHRLMLCAARALVGSVAAQPPGDGIDDKLQRVWQQGSTAATSVRVGHYQLDTRADPLELNLYPTR